ncbi:MAG: hypothetical protein KIT33_04460 [Candidatus Kapabacteria bacterium]|nr:hypothetical protein [Ignavibacteriota bacterium]MCW5884209.1 hypothetical protein [Candidatus Kapabacteria bacterium]
MKRFVDVNGTFDIQIPENWKYTVNDGKVHTFQYYISERNFDTFQLSINELSTPQSIKRFKLLIKGRKYKILNDVKFFDVSNPSVDKNQILIFVSSIENEIILFTFLFDIDQNVSEVRKFIEEKRNFAFEIISSFRLIRPEYSVLVYESYLFGNFMIGVGASNYLLNIAIEKKSFIEATCLLANIIDALLRIGIVLKYQLINKNSRIERMWIYQGDKDKIITEKKVYEKAKEIQIISESLFNELFALYDKRNRVVHRFIISEINLADVEEIATEYYLLFQKLNDIIKKIEEEQILTKTGMTVQSDDIDIDYMDLIKSKIINMDFIKWDMFQPLTNKLKT